MTECALKSILPKAQNSNAATDEVTGLDPAAVTEAPETEEDWGE